jgi:hypothetical protein
MHNNRLVDPCHPFVESMEQLYLAMYGSCLIPRDIVLCILRVLGRGETVRFSLQHSLYMSSVCERQ